MRPVALEVDSNCSRERTRLWVILKEVYTNSSVQVKRLSDRSISSKLYMKYVNVNACAAQSEKLNIVVMSGNWCQL